MSIKSTDESDMNKLDSQRSDLIIKGVSSFYQKHAEEYAKIWGDNDINLSQFYKKLIELVPNKGKLLDSGCGSGRDLYHLMKLDFDVHGISICKQEVDIASKKDGLNGRVEVMDMRDLKFPPSSFNVIWDNAAFLHIPSESAGFVLKGYYRVLNWNGILFLRVKEGEGETEIDTHEYEEGETRFYKLYQQEEIKRLVEENRFEIIEIGTLKAMDERPINWVHIFARKK